VHKHFTKSIAALEDILSYVDKVTILQKVIMLVHEKETR